MRWQIDLRYLILTRRFFFYFENLTFLKWIVMKWISFILLGTNDDGGNTLKNSILVKQLKVIFSHESSYSM